MPLPAQPSHRGREVTHGQVGLANITQKYLQLTLAAGRNAVHAEFSSRKIIQKVNRGKEMAEGMEFVHWPLGTQSILHPGLQDGSIWFIKELAGTVDQRCCGMPLTGDKLLYVTTKIGTMEG